MIVHDLKTLEEPWDAVFRGEKHAELRFDDREFKVGHFLNLIRIRKNSGESGATWSYSPIWLPAGFGPSREIRAQLVRVTHILRYEDMKSMECKNGIGLTPGWCILSFERSSVLLAGS